MLKFCGMDKNRFFGVIFILVLVSDTCNASLGSHFRKLVTSELNKASNTSQVSPSGSPVNESNTNPTNAGKSQVEKHKESQTSNQNNTNNRTLPSDTKIPKKNDNDSKKSGAPSPPAVEKNVNTVDKGNEKTANATTSKLGDNGSCQGSLISCRDKEMLACVEASESGGSKELFLVVQNEGETTLKVNVNFPNYLKSDLPAFEVPKHKAKRIDISSTVGKTNELIVNCGNAKCVLHLFHPVSVDNLIQQLSFYSKQVPPIYAVYASFVLVLLFGGTWACCKLRNRNQQDGIPYQELEMGLPESVPAVNVDAAEGWDHDWDDDWDEDSALRSPTGQQVRSVSADGLTSRPNKKGGWENDWDD